MPTYDVFRNGEKIGTVTATSEPEAEDAAVDQYGEDVYVKDRWNEPLAVVGNLPSKPANRFSQMC